MHNNNDKHSISRYFYAASHYLMAHYQMKRYNVLRLLTSALILLLVSACSSKVTVIADVPPPLVERVPLNVHLSYTEDFKNHIYVENEKKRALSSLDFADAQVEMFNAIFSNLTTLVEINDPSLDLIVEPQVLDFQYTAPSETKLKQYDVWIKYRLKLLQKDQSELADWVVKGHGKTPTSLLSNAVKAFNSAANVALRDIGAQLAISFPGQQKIKAMIDAKQNNTAAVDNDLSMEASNEQ